MLDLNDLYYFATLAERGSFTAAADAIGIPKGTLSRRLKTLESRLDLRLIDRTTRRFALTEAGEKLHHYARSAVQQAKFAEADLLSWKSEPVGRIRMTCPQGMLRSLITPLLVEFMDRHHGISIDVVASSRYVDLIAEGFDMGLRSHENELTDSSLVARRLATLQIALVASPAYLASKSAASLGDINGLDGLHMDTSNGLATWTLHGPNHRQSTVHLQHRLGSDDIFLLKAAAIAGQGVAVLPLHACLDELAQGSLIRVLPGWEVSRRTLSLILPTTKGLMPAVRAWADFLAERVPVMLEGLVGR
ncbi:LysR substrate-binding domain-containing protein [Dyella tabacisoli]|uniref:LysR family transcriptional regulator n=1 Tax=Dyella tabacisoli TaxID=2282381 RepID=A0A369UHW4_9GAMM|nr:LysR substrate-binding domain-containing protein [Dyella tabacisoli]RDD80161.1 LysR family transcriptional regulator [Dyella tabacisoli]